MAFDDIIRGIELLCEKRKTIPKTKPKNKSTKSRVDRAKNVKVKYLKKKKTDNPHLSEYTFKATSKEQTEAKTHEGSVSIFNKSGRIDNLFCDCSDFASRYHHHRNKEGVSKWDNDIKAKKDIFQPHTRDAPNIMNPNSGDGYACKHLIKAIEVIKDRF